MEHGSPCLVGTDGVEPSSSRLQRDARTVSAAFPWRSGRESNALVACATHRHSKSTPYRSATTPGLRIQFSKDALNQTCTTVHVMKFGVTDQTRTDFNRLHKPAPRPLRPRSPCRPGRSRTAFVRFGIALVAVTRTRTNTEGTGLRRSPRGTHKSFGASVMTWRSYLPAARRTSRTISRSDDTNSRIARCNLVAGGRVGWMRFAAS